MSAFSNGLEVRKLREKLRLNQTQFWSRVSVNQSAASRYETGREIPVTVQHLLTIAFGTEKQAITLVRSMRNEK